MSLVLGWAVVLLIYIVLRVAFVWFFCGGDTGGNYYSDSQE